MLSVSQRASAATWTCQVVPRNGRLLDIAEMARVVRHVGTLYSLRGVEATVVGQLVRLDGQAVVRLNGTGEVLRLGPLRRKVQWDPVARRDQPMTADERSAHDRLIAQWRDTARPVRLVGPLGAPSPGGGPMLEVRQFTWLR